MKKSSYGQNDNFYKGSIKEGPGVTITGRTSNRLVGLGDIEITYQSGGFVEGSTYKITSSYAISSVYSNTASYALNGGGMGVTVGGSYNISASWVSQSLSSSYVVTSVNSNDILKNNSIGVYRGVNYIGNGSGDAKSLCGNVIYAGGFSGNDWALQISNSLSTVEDGVATVIKVGSGIKVFTTASVPIILKPYCGLEFEFPMLLELGNQYIELNLCSFIIGHKNRSYRSDADAYTQNSCATTFVCNTDFYNNESSGSCIITKNEIPVKSIVLSDLQITRNRAVSCVDGRKAIYLKGASNFILKNITVSMFRYLGHDYGTGLLIENVTGSNTAWGNIDNIRISDCGYGFVMDGSPSLGNTVGYSHIKTMTFGGCKHSIYLKGAINNKFDYVCIQGDMGTDSTQIWIESVPGAAGGSGGGANNWFEWIDLDNVQSTQNIKLDVVNAIAARSNKINSKDVMTISSSVGYSGFNTTPVYDQSLVPGVDSYMNLTTNWTQNTGSDVKVYVHRGAPVGRSTNFRIIGNGLADANGLDLNVASNGTSLIRYNNFTMLGFSVSTKYINVPVGTIQSYATGDGRLGSVVKVNNVRSTSSLIGNECGIATLYSGAFSTDGDSAKYTAFGIINGSVSTKRIQLYWSGSSGLLLADSSAGYTSVSASWKATTMVTRRGLSNQILSGDLKIVDTVSNAVLFDTVFCKTGSFSLNGNMTLSTVLSSDSLFSDLSNEHSIAEWCPNK